MDYIIFFILMIRNPDRFLKPVRINKQQKPYYKQSVIPENRNITYIYLILHQQILRIPYLRDFF